MRQVADRTTTTDLFAPIIERAVEVVGKSTIGDRAARPTGAGDHAPAVAFLLADGAYPSEEGAATYCGASAPRRRHAWLLGAASRRWCSWCTTSEWLDGNVYPELVQKRQSPGIRHARRRRALLRHDRGRLERLSTWRVRSHLRRGGVQAVHTFGFPIDLTQLIAGERGRRWTSAGFERELGKQRPARSEALERSKVTDVGTVAVT